jgi:hypothetical protein
VEASYWTRVMASSLLGSLLLASIVGWEYRVAFKGQRQAFLV